MLIATKHAAFYEAAFSLNTSADITVKGCVGHNNLSSTFPLAPDESDNDHFEKLQHEFHADVKDNDDEKTGHQSTSMSDDGTVADEVQTERRHIDWKRHPLLRLKVSGIARS